MGAAPLIRRGLFGLVGLCARWSPPRPAEPAALATAMAGIRLYRLLISPLAGRGCFFSLTCSRYAEQQLRAHGWSAGWTAARQRLEDCGGNHTLLVGVDGLRRLRAASGRCYEDHELAGGPPHPGAEDRSEG